MRALTAQARRNLVLTDRRTSCPTIMALAASLAGCGAAENRVAAPADKAAGGQAGADASGGSRCEDARARTPLDPGSIEVIRPDHRVPAFSVTSIGCDALGSEQLVGPRPLVIVFFSSWCAVCDMKIPIVAEAARQLGPTATFVGVALDDDDTWHAVAPFVERHGIDFPIVRGVRFPAFSLGYNPFAGVPVVVVVGRDGHVVDVQIGYSPLDQARLMTAAEVARRTNPNEDTRAPAQSPVTLPDSGT